LCFNAVGAKRHPVRSAMIELVALKIVELAMAGERNAVVIAGSIDAGQPFGLEFSPRGDARRLLNGM
jgi:hypothetical protein